MKKNKHMLLRLLLALLAAAIAAGVMFIAARKAYSLYTSLSRKIDYANSTLYTLSEDVSHMRSTINREFSSFDFDYSWADQPLAAHAFGAVDGHAGTNSLEAFEQNYALGHRIFEVDLDITEEDYTLVATHDPNTWKTQAGLSADAVFSHDGFMHSQLHGQYTTMDFKDVVDLLVRYPDIYLITDTKHTDKASVLLQFSQLVRYAGSVDSALLDRIIPQIYHEDMLGWIMSVHPFKSVIYTLYMTGSNAQNAFDVCMRTGIRFLTVPDEWVHPEGVALWKSLGITVAAHTVNDMQLAQQCLNMGVDMLYTDSLLPAGF